MLKDVDCVLKTVQLMSKCDITVTTVTTTTITMTTTNNRTTTTFLPVETVIFQIVDEVGQVDRFRLMVDFYDAVEDLLGVLESTLG